MSNFISEILDTASEIENSELRQAISAIITNTHELRHSVRNHMDESYLKLKDIKKPLQLIHNYEELNANVVDLEKRIDNYTKNELERLSKEMVILVESFNQSQCMVQIIGDLLKLDNNIVEMKANNRLHKYIDGARCYKNALDIAYNNENLEFIDIMGEIKLILNECFSEFSLEMENLWKKSITIVFNEINEVNGSSLMAVNNSTDELASLMGSLYIYGRSKNLIYAFSCDFFEKIIKLCIKYSTTVELILEGTKQLHLKFDMDRKSSFLEVISNLTKIFVFAKDTLEFDVWDETTDEIPNPSGNKNNLFLRQVGSHIEEEIVEFLVQDCLQNAIPSRKSQLPQYAQQIQSIVDFQSLLIDIGFLSEKSPLLEKYCGNVVIQFKEKTLARYLEEARNIYKKPLQDKIQIDTQLGKQETMTAGESLMKLDMSVVSNILDVNQICSNMFCFPKCFISKSTEDLVELGEQILKDLFSSEEFDSEIFMTARDIFFYYSEFVPQIHKNLLESLPEQSALFHNNCCYLAHKMITINEKYRSLIPPNWKVSLAFFVDMARTLILSGIQILTQQLNKQDEVLLKIMENSHLSTLSNFEKLPPETEKSIKQSLHTLSYLQTVWLPVLTPQIYCQIMGSLVNGFLVKIINKVVNASDIGSGVATPLVRIFTNVINTVPNLFPDPKEVIIHVGCWSRFKELVFVIDASLVSIGERWADGKGPLAVAFSSTEIQQLIRALFQVSDRRAALLAKLEQHV